MAGATHILLNVTLCTLMHRFPVLPTRQIIKRQEKPCRRWNHRRTTTCVQPLASLFHHSTTVAAGYSDRQRGPQAALILDASQFRCSPTLSPLGGIPSTAFHLQRLDATLNSHVRAQRRKKMAKRRSYNCIFYYLLAVCVKSPRVLRLSSKKCIRVQMYRAPSIAPHIY